MSSEGPPEVGGADAARAGAEVAEREAVEVLIERGDYHAAARRLADEGQLERAQALLEKVWDFAAAAEVARARGDRPATLRLLLDGRDAAGAGELLMALAAAGDEAERVAAAEVCERRRMWREAGLLLERAGQPAAARERYARGGLLLEAGRVDERLGRLREAGMAYERALELAGPGGGGREAAAARLGLGRVLGLLGRHEEAARQLQRALAGGALDEAAAREAEGLLALSLAGLGLREAAEAVLAGLRRQDPSVPPLAEFLARAEAARGGGDLLAGRYRVVRLLGAGAMGRVYLALDRVTDEEVAVKVVAPPIEPRAREAYRRFLREAKAVAAIHHPNVVAAREVLEAEGLLVMEYLVGGTLEARVASPAGGAAGLPGGARLGGGPTASARKLLLEVVAGLQAAHAHGVVHRDVKPANVFFAATGEAKLGDFGAAHLQDLGATRTAGFVGTLAYMAPEQITAAPIGFACDVYALGVTAFQLVTGRLPFEGPDFVGQHLGEPPPPPSSRAPRAGEGATEAAWPAWDKLILRMLAKDPGARHPSLEALRRELEALPVLEPPAPGAPGAHGSAGVIGQEPAPAPSSPSAGSSARYRVEADAGSTATSTLHHAIDERLGRPVTLERFQPGALAGEAGAARVARLRTFARFGGPHLQRVLRLDLDEGLAVYEAVPGVPLADLIARSSSLPAGFTPRLLALAVLSALAGPHRDGVGHGALARSIVLEPSGPTVLVAGTVGEGSASPDEDLVALRALLGGGINEGVASGGGGGAGGAG